MTQDIIQVIDGICHEIIVENRWPGSSELYLSDLMEQAKSRGDSPVAISWLESEIKESSVDLDSIREMARMYSRHISLVSKTANEIKLAYLNFLKEKLTSRSQVNFDIHRFRWWLP